MVPFYLPKFKGNSVIKIDAKESDQGTKSGVLTEGGIIMVKDGRQGPGATASLSASNAADVARGMTLSQHG